MVQNTVLFEYSSILATHLFIELWYPLLVFSKHVLKKRPCKQEGVITKSLQDFQWHKCYPTAHRYLILPPDLQQNLTPILLFY